MGYVDSLPYLAPSGSIRKYVRDKENKELGRPGLSYIRRIVPVTASIWKMII